MAAKTREKTSQNRPGSPGAIACTNSIAIFVFWTGMINDIHIYDKALSEDEIVELAQ